MQVHTHPTKTISQTQTQTQAQTQTNTYAETVQLFAFTPRNQILCLGVFVLKLNTPCHPRPSRSFPRHPHFRILLNQCIFILQRQILTK